MTDRFASRSMVICERCWTVVAIDGENNTARFPKACSHLGPHIEVVPVAQAATSREWLRGREDQWAVAVEAIRLWLDSPQPERNRLRGIRRALDDPKYAVEIVEAWEEDQRA
jgi:hypothetical protein